MQRPVSILMFAGLLAHAAGVARADIQVTDDSGRRVTLKQPARRILSLAPHLTELLFAAGAGAQVVGVVDYSDYPEAARRIARVGNSGQLDLERIVALRPDLVVVWQHGNAQKQLEKLLRMGIPIFYNQPHRLPDIGKAIEQFGRLAGTEVVAGPAARAFAAREARLRARYSGRPLIDVFYQIWARPLMTINGQHLISDMITLCGGRNVFARLKDLAPTISTEAVLAARPEVIGTAIAEPGAPDGLQQWKKWPQLPAIARNNLFTIHTDLVSRSTPRILEGAQQLCEHLEKARAKRPR